jgi:MSHA pilin protein MshC
MDKSQQGFTLIELITVIILLGILSAFAVSRFPSSQSYSTNIITNQFIASARLAQQTSLSRSSVDSSNYTTLNVSGSAGNWNLVVTSGLATYNAQVDQGSEQIRFGTDLSSTCASLAAVPLTLTFDGDGNRVPAQNLRVCIDSAVDVELCISPSGYVYEDSCIP